MLRRCMVGAGLGPGRGGAGRGSRAPSGERLQSVGLVVDAAGEGAREGEGEGEGEGDR